MLRVSPPMLEMARFGSVGVVATAVHYGVALVANAITGPYLANVAGYCAAVSVSYIGHQRFTFRISPELALHRRRFPRFVATSLSALVLSQAVLAGGLAGGIPDALALAGAVLIVPPYTFVVSRFWVFSHRTRFGNRPD